MKRLILLIAVAASGCAAPTVSDLRSPDGTAMKNVKCNIDAQRCLTLASESCRDKGGTYQVIRSHSNAGGTAADILPGPVTWYNMTYVCGPSDGRMPDFPFQGQQYNPPPMVIQQPAVRPTYQPPRSTTTNCMRIGDQVTCTTN